MHFSPGKEGQGVHSQRFVDVLEKRAKEVGANLIIKPGRQSLIQFLTTKLKAKPNPTVGQRPGAKEASKPFPKHWGDPPAIQTRDYRKLPGGYGFGSGTLANWIQKHLQRDAEQKLKDEK